ncbi:hypothetical protein [Cryobacterium sp. MLB-32]|uniref:hypothetical protein n=1 Tax=Cryobacterium sp. MLB-32 TaxID=1529318 RepID=UPI00068DCBAD|nr:hypothetical protein [Cryobacterium sp. MLB-32]
MKKLHFTVGVDAPARHLWATMLDETTYREWTGAFNSNSNSDSHFEGTWEVGDTIRFVGLDSKGSVGGMIATVVDNRPGEFVSLEYVGQVLDGVDDTTSEFARAITGTHELYSFTAIEALGGALVTRRVEHPNSPGWIQVGLQAANSTAPSAPRTPTMHWRSPGTPTTARESSPTTSVDRRREPLSGARPVPRHPRPASQSSDRGRENQLRMTYPQA